MGRPRVGLDLDGVIFDWDTRARELLNLHFGYKLRRASKSWDELELKIKPKHWKWLWSDGLADLYHNMPMFKGTWVAMRELEELADIVIITSRPRDASSETIADLLELSVPISEFHIIGRNVDKGGVTKNLELFVDDRLKNLLSFVEHGFEKRSNLLLWTRPHNAGDSWEHRVDTWDQVIAKVKELR